MIMKYGQSYDDGTIIKEAYKRLNTRFGTLLEFNAQRTVQASGSMGDPSQQINPHFNDAPEKDKSQINRTWLSFLELAASDTAQGHAPIALFTATALWGFYTETWKKSISPWIEQKQMSAWNFLRGGSYSNADTPGLLSLEPKVNFDHMV